MRDQQLLQLTKVVRSVGYFFLGIAGFRIAQVIGDSNEAAAEGKVLMGVSMFYFAYFTGKAVHVWRARPTGQQ